MYGAIDGPLYFEKENGEKLDRSERLCSICLKNDIHVVGDEKHALIKCPYFDKRRNDLFDVLDTDCPNFISLDENCKLEYVEYILTYEGRFIDVISKFVQSVLSVERKCNVVPKAKIRELVKKVGTKKQRIIRI